MRVLLSEDRKNWERITMAIMDFGMESITSEEYDKTGLTCDHDSDPDGIEINYIAEDGGADNYFIIGKNEMTLCVYSKRSSHRYYSTKVSDVTFQSRFSAKNETVIVVINFTADNQHFHMIEHTSFSSMGTNSNVFRTGDKNIRAVTLKGEDYDFVDKFGGYSFEAEIYGGYADEVYSKLMQ